ncbi:MAG: hypothetical protein Q8P67_10185 [archaeon]|nr:hypothetical protein [archaeon]
MSVNAGGGLPIRQLGEGMRKGFETMAESAILGHSGDLPETIEGEFRERLVEQIRERFSFAGDVPAAIQERRAGLAQLQALVDQYASHQHAEQMQRFVNYRIQEAELYITVWTEMLNTMPVREVSTQDIQ